MLRKDDWMDIKEQAKKGMYQKDIAERIGISQKTVQEAYGARDAV